MTQSNLLNRQKSEEIWLLMYFWSGLVMETALTNHTLVILTLHLEPHSDDDLDFADALMSGRHTPTHHENFPSIFDVDPSEHRGKVILPCRLPF